MFHVKHSVTSALDRVAEWLGLDLDEKQRDSYERFARWLVVEALPAGGIGPSESDRIWARHLADSLLFSAAVKPGGHVLDVGSGVGLPAIPLAIAHPEAEFVALDRSGRRADLAARAVRVTGIENIEVRQDDVNAITERFSGVTFRAVADLMTAVRWSDRLLIPGGVGMVGMTRRRGPVLDVPRHSRLEIDIVEIPEALLDARISLLRIRRRVDS